MDKIVEILTRLDLHPVVDHFTVSLLIVGVLIDLIASVAPTRTWLRYMALTLMILGAIAAGASYATGDLEADRVFDAMSAPAKAVFHWHAMLGEYFAVVFGVLAVWRILIQGVGFFGGSRPVYLVFAAISVGVLLYIGSLGGQMVYTYGVGTALMSTPTSSADAGETAPPIGNESLPTVTVPTATSFDSHFGADPSRGRAADTAPLPTATATPASE